MSVYQMPERKITDEQRPLVEAFCTTARELGHDPITLDENGHIGVTLTDGRNIDALAIFEDELGNWVLLNAETLKVEQHFGDEVR